MMLLRIRGLLRREGGFTLIELVAAMGIFALAAASVLGVLVAGIRAAGFARDRTIGKDLARQQLEDMRRLPFYLSFTAPYNRKADLLDNFYPDSGNATPTGYVVSDPADPYYRVDVNPVAGFARYRMEIYSRFVDQDLKTQPPDPGYIWNDPAKDKPISRLLSVEVRTFWTVGGRPNNFVVRTQIGEGVLEEVLVQGTSTATIVRIDTGFSDSSFMFAEAGRGTSSVFEGRVTTSRNETQSALARVIETDGSFIEMAGFIKTALAPPDIGPIASETDGVSKSLVHSPAGSPITVARVFTNTISEVEAKVISTTPQAKGKVIIRDTGSDEDLGWGATNEMSSAPPVYLDTTKDFIRVIKSGSGKPLVARTSCVEATTTPKKVTCETTGSVDRIRLIPGNFVLLGVPAAPENGYIVSIRLTELKARAVAANPTEAVHEKSVDFAGELRYYTFFAGVWSTFTISFSDGGANVLPDPATICVVTTITGCTVKLSDYISSWSIPINGITTVANGGREVDASLPAAVTITTQPTNPTIINSGFIINLGNIRSSAVDLR